MAQAHSVLSATSGQQWDGRIVNGRFPLLQYLGGVDDTVVYLTEIEDAKAVIKLIAADAPRAQTQVASWKLASHLSHPNLVRILDMGLWHADGEHDMHFAVVEYCEESLAEVLRERPLTPSETRQMLVPALDALKYLHGQGITHGQVSPKTIRAAGNQVKLSSDALRRNAETFPTAATSPYDPPEKATGAMSLSADIWSLGMTVYEALTAHLPASGPAAVPDRSAKLPPPFEGIVEGCLRPDRERRLSVSAIRQLLEQVNKPSVSESPSSAAAGKPALLPAAKPPAPAAPTSAPTPAAPPSSRSGIEKRLPFAGNKRLTLMAGAVLAIVVIIALISLSHRAPETPAPSPAEPALPAPAATSHIPASDSSVTAGSVRHQVLPEIAAKARNTIDGTVKVNVKVEVNAAGKVTRASLASRGPSRYFAGRALDAARQWTFVAPARNGRAQASQWTVRFEFRRNATKATAQRNPVA